MALVLVFRHFWTGLEAHPTGSVIVFLGEPEQTAYDLHFSIAGIPVRVHPFFWLVTLFMGSSGGLDAHLMIWIGVVFVSILIHELGHAFTMRRYGESPRVVLYSMGGLAISDGSSRFGSSSRGRGRNPMEQIIISFAGPAAGFIFAAIVIALVSGMGARVTFHKPELDQLIFWHVEGIANNNLRYIVSALLYVNIFWGLVNLLPVFPLDGGQIARQVLTTRDPYEGVRKSLMLSVFVGGAMAVLAYARWHQMYTAIMFAMLAFSSYTELQRMGGGRGRGGMVMPATGDPAVNVVARRVVVLGASNVTRSISTVVETACQIWGRPADILVAAGHGRSYGRTSRVLVRRLPSILACGLWKEFFERPPLPTAALVTDIGNDILYGASVAEIVAWVTECLERLAPRCEQLVITELPIASVAELDEIRFVMMRSLLFPRSTLQLERVIEKAMELNQAVREISLQFQAKCVAPEPAWYGIDPIHVRRKVVREAWFKMLSPWSDEPTKIDVRASWRRWWYLRWRRPLMREFFGRVQHTLQPSARLAEGTLVSQF